MTIAPALLPASAAPSLPIDARDIALAKSGGNDARLRDISVNG